MAKRRRQASLRISWLDRNSSNGIGRFLVQIPPGERKSGMPHSVEIPAPVNGTTTEAASISSRSRATPVSTSDAIIYDGPHRPNLSAQQQRLLCDIFIPCCAFAIL